MRPFVKTLAINVLVLAALLPVVEILFRTLHPIPDLWNSENSKVGWRWRESGWRKWLIETGVRGTSFWSADESNQLGFRGRKIDYQDGDFVILLVGDSQVEAAASRLEEMPEAILQRLLRKNSSKNVRVFSIGTAGWSQDQQLLALREYFGTFRANLVLLWHTPSNDYWENTFPDRSVGSIKGGAGHLKPTFLLQGNGDLDLFRDSVSPSDNWIDVVHSLNLGRGLLYILSEFGYDLKRFQINESSLKAWLQLLPPAVGHKSIDKAQCPSEIVPQWSFSQHYDEYVGRPLTLWSTESIDESRSHLIPFLDPPSLRDIYAKRVTRALIKRIKELAEQNGATFMAFSSEIQTGESKFFSEVKCVKSDEKLYKVNGDLFAPLRGWEHRLNFERVPIEVSQYGVAAIIVDPRYDPLHFNYFGNSLVMKAVAERVRSHLD
jgi:hypothetical protein